MTSKAVKLTLSCLICLSLFALLVFAMKHFKPH